MTAIDDHWPSLPPIRTSSSNSRVSCESLNLHTPPPASLSADTRTFAITPPSASHWVRPTSKSADASPRYSQPSSPSHGFSCCFGHKSSRGHGHDRGRRGGAQGSFDAPGLLRSIFGFSSPMVSYASGASPSNWQSPQSNWQTPPSLTSSPSGRTSPINSLRPGVATPHAGVLLRNSKGHTAHVHAFTMMPSDVVGKKKPPGYESDEPTSPEVTCIGKVRRKHCKATWDASVKEKQKDAKKKGKGKKTPQRSEAHRSLSFQGIPTDFDVHTPTHKDSTKDDDAISSQALTESSNGDAHTYSRDFPGCDSPLSCAQSQSGMLETQSNLQGERIVGTNHEDFEGSLCDQKAGSGTPTAVSETPPPPNCLLLMKKGSRNRSAHYCSDEQALHEPTIQQWNFGQTSILRNGVSKQMSVAPHTSILTKAQSICTSLLEVFIDSNAPHMNSSFTMAILFAYALECIKTMALCRFYGPQNEYKIGNCCSLCLCIWMYEQLSISMHITALPEVSQEVLDMIS